MNLHSAELAVREPDDIAAARAFTGTRLRCWGTGTGSIITARLLTSELVTNALAHAAGPVRLRLTLDGTPQGAVRIEVSDASPAPARRRDGVRPTDTNGRGLLIVDALADTWGSAPSTERGFAKTTWCTIASRARGGTA